MFFQTMSQLGDTFQGIIKISNGSVRVLDPSQIRGPLLERLAFTAALHEKVEMRGTARWLIKMFTPHFGIDIQVHQKDASASGPKIKIHGMSYALARTLFRTARTYQLRTFILIAEAKKQAESMGTISAAAIEEGFQGRLIFQTQDSLNIDTDLTLLETHCIASQEKKEPEISITENPEMQTLHIDISVFSNKVIPIEKQEEFLWQLPSTQREHISLEIEKKLEAHFKKYNPPGSLPMIQKREIVSPKSFALRDEIAAAITESDTDQEQPFSKSLAGLKTKRNSE